jgi:hypothetical protein
MDRKKRIYNVILLAGLIISLMGAWAFSSPAQASSPPDENIPTRQVYGIVQYRGPTRVAFKDPLQPKNDSNNIVAIESGQSVRLSASLDRYRNIGGVLWYSCDWETGDAIVKNIWISEEHIVFVEQLP